MRAYSKNRNAEAISVLRHVLDVQPNSETALYMLSELRRSDPAEAKVLQQKYEAARQKESSLAEVKSVAREPNEAARRQDWPQAITP